MIWKCKKLWLRILNTAESEEAEKAILGAETEAKAKAESEENIRTETESESEWTLSLWMLQTWWINRLTKIKVNRKVFFV